MNQPLPELFDAPDDTANRLALGERFRGLPGDIIACATAIAQDGRVPGTVLTASARAEVAALDRANPNELREEMSRMLVGRNVHVALQWMHDVGAMERLLPELDATVDFSQESGRKHKDVWEHTKQVVRQAIPDPSVRWGALLHDIGKVPTRTFTSDGGVHFHGHAEVGARMFDPISRRFAFERPLRQKVRFLILHHLRANQYAPSWTDSAVRRFDREMGEHLDDLLCLSRADITSKRPGRRQELLVQINQLQTRIRDLRELDAKQPPLPTGLGTAISERFGIPPSRRIGDLKRLLEDACEKGELEERREDGYYLDWLAANGHVAPPPEQP
jgi:poly(A) polymerase